MCLFGFGVVDKKMFYIKYSESWEKRKTYSARQQGCPREDLPPSVLFFIGTLSQTLTLRAPLSIPPTPFSRGRSRPSGSPSPQDSPASQLRPSIWWCLILRTMLFRLYSPEKRLPMLGTHDATRKSLIITALSIFRVGIFTTLKMAKQLSLSDLQVTLRIFRYLL